MAAVVFYVSGHGFGHASRQIEIINALGAKRPDVEIVVRTSAPVWLFDRTATVPFAWRPATCDTGVVQIDSLRLDACGTIREADGFHRTLSDRARIEAALLVEHDTRLVVSDAPPLACAAAAAAGVPAVVVSNFTWDWIYAEYREFLAAAPNLLPTIRGAYRQALAGWRLPMHGGFESFARVDDVPFVARHARVAPEMVRRSLKLPNDRPLALSSFGGYGIGGFDAARLDCLGRWGVVLTQGPKDSPPTVPPGVFVVREDELYDAGLRYEDLVAAVDVVVTKPGYGIISECIANGTGLLYTSRGRFAEYPVLVEEMPRYLRCGFLEIQSVLAGQWGRALDDVLAADEPRERPATNGADILAERISELTPDGRS